MKKRTFFPKKGQSYSLISINKKILIDSLKQRYKIPHIARNLFHCSKESLYKYCRKNNIDYKKIYQDSIKKYDKIKRK